MKDEIRVLDVCRCGHTGNDFNTQHKDTFQGGHGACIRCPCIQYTWTGDTENADEYGNIL